MRERIRMIMESQHMAQNSFAQFIGLSPATLSSIFNGRTNPTLGTVEAIHSKLPLLNTEWLMFGTGQMFKIPNSKDNNPKSTDDQTPTEQSLVFESDTPQSSPLLSQETNAQKTNFQPKKTEMRIANNFDKTKRTITEIRVFFDDQTYESFVPKK